jgi:hypothetical protein
MLRSVLLFPPREKACVWGYNTNVFAHHHLYNAEGTPKLLEMTIGEETFVYWLTILDADYGLGVEVRKPLPETNVYHVHYDPLRQISSCDCLGGSHHGHCKHLEAIVALLRAGKLVVPQQPDSEAAPEPIPEPAKTVGSTAEPAEPRYCRHCGCLESEHVAGFCPA